MSRTTRTKVWKPNKTAWDRQAKGSEFRNLIRAEMRRQNVSSYWVANSVSERNPELVTPDAVYRYLRAETDATGAIIAAIFKVLRINPPTRQRLDPS